MKKAISILLVLALSLSICACGSNDATDATETVNVKEAVIGEWECHEEKTYKDKTFMTTTTLTIYIGGTGVYYRPASVSIIGYSHSYYNIEWEIKDGVLNVVDSFSNRVDGFTYDPSTDTLTKVDGTLTLTRKIP